ncbi:O-antigen ligase family protein [Pseudidiomarina insulisalsae]|uniref:O-antigen ligase domain-containing protein n=1 Tax=Pseudidiomarina insulisalsae TaxID=575789 RepID=A0A432YNZ5_9GAMM|nr:O-antigen ligase family protein [Pseudidiomarina insulisalsae]RUO62612.1 hypothetical protein CWI71_04045 [Pseudidiomarina insulisalsae]
MQFLLQTIANHERLISFNLSHLTLFAMAFLLWVDTLTGMSVYYGVGIGSISMLYKLMIIGLVFVIIGSHSPRLLALFLFGFIILLIGPSQSFLTFGESKYYFDDISYALKLLTPVLIFSFMFIIKRSYPELINYWLPVILFSNFAAVIFNLVLGKLGFGWPSYSGTAGQPGIGVNGFYVAGNELSACFVLLYGFVLHHVWLHRSKWSYVMVALSALYFGAAIATKTAMLASLLLVFLVPLINEREHLFKFTKLKLALLGPFLIVTFGVVLFIEAVLTSIGLWEKFTWIIAEKGVLTLIVSGRDEKASQLLAYFEQYASVWDYLWGIGASGITHFEPIFYGAEVDPVDIFIWFGFTGVLIVLAGIVVMNYLAVRAIRSPAFYPPIIVLVNLILLLLSLISGHIWASGMLGILWGAFNGLIFVQNERVEAA